MVTNASLELLLCPENTMESRIQQSIFGLIACFYSILKLDILFLSTKIKCSPLLQLPLRSENFCMVLLTTQYHSSERTHTHIHVQKLLALSFYPSACISERCWENVT